MRYSIDVFVKERFFFIWRWIERVRGQLMTFHRRPLYARDYLLKPDVIDGDDRLAVILQGPLVRENDFTIETVKLYRVIFPDSPVIVSTWDYEQKTHIHQLENEGAIVVLSKKPTYAGPYNVNFQITSTRAGIEYAKRIGIEYVIKSRTDQRIYNPNSRMFLFRLMNAFPLTHQYSLQKYRIVTLSYATFKNKPYHPSDIFMFGYVNDMLLYWQSALIYHQPKELVRPEQYLFTEYLKRIGRNIQGTIQDSWSTYAQHIVVVDHAALDWYWYKQKRIREYPAVEYYRDDNRLVSFLEWLILYDAAKK